MGLSQSRILSRGRKPLWYHYYWQSSIWLSSALACPILFWAPHGPVIRLELGAGAVDAALNNYVAVHYSSRQMSWLHAFWGVGVTISPYIMSSCLTGGLGWQTGYRRVSLLQIVLTVILFAALPLWRRSGGASEGAAADVPLSKAVKIPGVPFVMLAFLGFCALETTAGLWASSYLVGARGVDAETAAKFTALFYMGETVGRVANGFVADRFGDRNMIRVGLVLILAGIGRVLVPINTVALTGLVVVGLGAAPVYPCIIHATPYNFGTENSQALVGIQMASAYTGSTLMPPLFGLIAQHINVGLYPFYLLLFAGLMLVMTELLNRAVGRRRQESGRQ